MSAGATNPNDVKLLPPGEAGQGLSAGVSAAVGLPPSSPATITVVPSAPSAPSTAIAPRQLADLPKDE